MARTLADLRPGQSGRIAQIIADFGLRHRLLEMGLTTGTPIQLIRIAPLGDPVEVELRGYRLSVRRREAGRVKLEAD